MKRVLILGASGSIGTNAIEVIQDFPDSLKLVGVQVHKNKKLLSKLKKKHPGVITASSSEGETIADISGPDLYKRLIDAAKPDIVVNGISGSPGLMPSVITLESGIDLALANKETVVMAGEIIFDLATSRGVSILPVDSEHSALFHLLEGKKPEDIKQLLITASGGPFFGFSRKDLIKVGVQDALKHPTWKMGGKITVDSATLANKGLELIEAMYLFGVPEDRIRVLVHRQSKVHALVRMTDGALYAQISDPDMKHPIHNALFYPEKHPCSYGEMDLVGHILNFNEPDGDAFPLLPLSRICARNRGLYPVAYNAANEVAVELFLKRKLAFNTISDLVSRVLDEDIPTKAAGSIEEILDANTFYHERARVLRKELPF